MTESVTVDKFYSEASRSKTNGKAGAKDKTPEIEFLDHDVLFDGRFGGGDMVVPGLGIAPGPPNAIIGSSYVGKTIIAMSMGMAVALGVPVWGKFKARKGKLLLFDYEQGQAETSKRIYRIAGGLRVGREALRGRMAVAIYPKVNLTTQGALDAYCKAMEGSSMAVIDSLKGCTPGVEENSSAMRDYLQILSRASEKTGCAVVLIHHSGLAHRARKDASRGHSGIKDEIQSMYVVTCDEGDAVRRVTHEKDRALGHTIDEFGLCIEDVRTVFEADYYDKNPDDFDLRAPFYKAVTGKAAWPLRVVVAESNTVQADRIVRWLAERGNSFDGNRKALVKAVEMNTADGLKALSDLEKAERVTITSNPYRIVLNLEPGSATMESA